MKVMLELNDVVMPNGQDGVTLKIIPLENVDPADFEKEPTKAMWISATLIELFNSGALQPIVMQYQQQVGGERGSRTERGLN